jgi:adenylosuccinate lyase
VTDNADLIQHKEAMVLIRRRLLNLIAALKEQAIRYRDLPTVGYTHLQPAQPTTLGKRITLWIQDLLLDLEALGSEVERLRFRGARGATGTEASFNILFGGDGAKIEQLNRMIAEKMGFTQVFGVSAQTYPRKVDAYLLGVLSGIAQSLSKFANDIRLLQNFGELQEPFGEAQVGSSAMPHKRNPMRCERINALARHVMVVAQDPVFTAASQWLERTLDDSANKRISVPEAYLATDAILLIAHNVAAGLRVFPEIAARRLDEQMPYLAAEPLMIHAAKRGGDRQKLHERIRRHAVAAAERAHRGESNDMIERLATDREIGIDRAELERLLSPGAMVGRAPQQVTRFLAEWVDPMLLKYEDELETDSPQLSV